MRALAEGMSYADGVLLYRYSNTPLFEREFGVLVREHGLRAVFLPGSRRSDTSWAAAAAGDLDDVTALRNLVPDIAERDLYVCGPASWTESVRRAATTAGVPAKQLHVESFGW